MLGKHGEPLLTWHEMNKSRLLKEPPLTDKTLKWRTSLQDQFTGSYNWELKALVLQAERLAVWLAHAKKKTKNPYFKNCVHIKE